ncbi:MAG: polyprenyl synthetase family protein [Candidatus Endonucleobacter sp. (ex Gigantidas childressi)]|nr:polyprenyl synthetase family protein [Candidatus Endonucleobacter sp. (ex Gigantidas childressi)]
MDRCSARVDKALRMTLPSSNPVNETLSEAMRYCVLNGGKRIRPIFAYAALECIGGDLVNADPAACAVELIHAYSLVHDDLPAMDDDDLRRGQPTCHKVYDEATAILAGDALQTLAFEVLSNRQLFPDSTISDTQRLQQVQAISVASGYAGMLGGQAMDIASVGLKLNQQQLIQMHEHKTGALIKASVRVGALSSTAIENWHLHLMDQYASAVGLAFQVQDDILDVITDTQTLGKKNGADEALNKPTYVSIMGLKEARQFAIELSESAISTLADFGNRAGPLQQLAKYIVERSY